MSRLSSDEAARQANIEQTTVKAAAQLEAMDLTDDMIVSEDIGDDWRRKFTSYVGDVSDDEMQAVWARLLAGEIVKPNSFGFRTLRVLSELDSETAKLFAEYGNLRLRDDTIFALKENWKSGAKFRQLARLADAGLIEPDPNISRILKRVENRVWVMGKTYSGYLYTDVGPDEAHITIRTLTRAGSELASLLPYDNEPEMVRSVLQEAKSLWPNSSFALLGPAKWVDDTCTLQSWTFLWGGQEDFLRSLGVV
nr:DUF2806 domain-containing protein [Alteraurantiacibacter buctensis]